MISDRDFEPWFRTVRCINNISRVLFYVTNPVLIAVISDGIIYKEALYDNKIYRLEISFYIHKYRCHIHKLLYKIIYSVIFINKSFYIYKIYSRCTYGKYHNDTFIIYFFIKWLLCCLIEIDSYIQQLRNGADIGLPYFHIAHFSLYTVDEKYLLILCEYFMPKSSSDSATDFIPYCSLVFLQTDMITG